MSKNVDFNAKHQKYKKKYIKMKYYLNGGTHIDPQATSLLSDTKTTWHQNLVLFENILKLKTIEEVNNWFLESTNKLKFKNLIDKMKGLNEVFFGDTNYSIMLNDLKIIANMIDYQFSWFSTAPNVNNFIIAVSNLHINGNKFFNNT